MNSIICLFTSHVRAPKMILNEVKEMEKTATQRRSTQNPKFEKINKVEVWQLRSRKHKRRRKQTG